MRDITLEDTIYIDFTTRAFATGIPTVLAGTPVLSVLEENNATPITAGVSVSVDRASVVGLNMATIVATAANGYENGKGYSIYISTGTVGGVGVAGEVVGTFTIGSSAAAVDLANATDGLSALKTLIDAVKVVDDAIKVVTDKFVFTVANQVDSNSLSVGGTAQTGNDNGADLNTLIIRISQTLNLTASGNIGIDWANVENPTTVVGLAATTSTAATPAQVLTQVNAALNTAISELSVAVPTANPNIRTGLMLLYMRERNLLNITASTKEVHNDAGTKIADKALSDNGTTYSEAKMA